MNRLFFNRLALGAILTLGLTGFTGCDAEPTETSPTLEVAALALGPGGFDSGAGLSADGLADHIDPVSAQANGCGQVFNFGHEAVVNTDPDVLARFPMRDVLDQIVALSGATQTDTDGLWSQWWSSSGSVRLEIRPTTFCDDNNARSTASTSTARETSRSWPTSHRRPTSPSRSSTASTWRRSTARTARSTAPCTPWMTPVGLNGKNFIIFEAVLPNPDLAGVAACREVVERWVEVADETDPTVRALEGLRMELATSPL